MGYDFTLEDRDARVLPRRSAEGLELSIEGRRMRADLEPGRIAGEYFLVVEGVRERLFLATRNDVHFVHWRGRTHRVTAWNALDRLREQAKRSSGAEEIRSPMPGVVVALAVAVGDSVETGRLLLTIESMKLQTAITASHPARIAEILVAPGETFDQGATLVRLEALAAADPVEIPAAASRIAAKPPTSKKGRTR